MKSNDENDDHSDFVQKYNLEKYLVRVEENATPIALTLFTAGSMAMLGIGFVLGQRKKLDIEPEEAESMLERRILKRGTNEPLQRGRKVTARSSEGKDGSSPRTNRSGMARGKLNSAAKKPKLSAPPAVLGAKAFAYGTVLCLVGSTVTVLGVGWYFGVASPQEFSDLMKERVPVHVRDSRKSMDPYLEGLKKAIAYPFEMMRPLALKKEEKENLDETQYRSNAAQEYKELKEVGLPESFLDAMYADRSKIDSNEKK